MTTDTQRELGILFGFVVIFLVVTAAYAVGWSYHAKREVRKEEERRELLTGKGFGSEKAAKADKVGNGADI